MFEKLKNTIAAINFLRSFNHDAIEHDETVDTVDNVRKSTTDEIARLVTQKNSKTITSGAFITKVRYIRGRLEDLIVSINKRIETLKDLKINLEKYRNVFFVGTKITSIQKEIDRLIETLQNLRERVIESIEALKHLV